MNISLHGNNRLVFCEVSIQFSKNCNLNSFRAEGHPTSCHSRHNLGLAVQLHSFLISALETGEWPTPRPGCFTVGKKRRYPLYRRLGGPQGRSGRKWRRGKVLPPPMGFKPRTVQPVASSYNTVMLNPKISSTSVAFALTYFIFQWYKWQQHSPKKNRQLSFLGKVIFVQFVKHQQNVSPATVYLEPKYVE